MDNSSQQISDILPLDADLFGGEISLGQNFTFHQTQTAKYGDLLSTNLNMVSDFGSASSTMLGKRHYFALTQSYRYHPGLQGYVQLEQPVIELHFQLSGDSKAVEFSQLSRSSGLNLDIRSGETNLFIVPPLRDLFELTESIGGNAFNILLSMEYLTDLSKRFPYHIEPVISKIKQKDFCLFREKNVCITPRMLGVMQRIQSCSDACPASSLFLESQILELLSYFFLGADSSKNTRKNTIPKITRERIHRAGEILAERTENPPTLAELAKLVGINEFTLKQGFKEIFGTTPYAFHLQHKLEYARSLVLDTDLTLSEIAYQIGYSGPAHFTNAFRKHFGMPPSRLR